MRHAIAGLVKLYIQRPGLVVEHARKAQTVLRHDGAASLMRLVRTRVGQRPDRSRAAAERHLRTRLQAIKPARAAHAEDILALLQPFVPTADPAGPSLTPDERLRRAEAHILESYCLLDDTYYAARYLGGDASARPIEHYLDAGVALGHRPNAFFDPLEYHGRYPDVAALGIEPVIHYALFGWKEGRHPGPDFDAAYYAASVAELAEGGTPPFVHFMRTGRHQNRSPRRTAPHRAGTRFAEMARTSGTLLIVSHDAELGGAQELIRSLAQWLLDGTRYEVKFVLMRGGAFADAFSRIAPTFTIGAEPTLDVAERLKDFAGDDVKAVLLNSVASGGFLNHWQQETPVLAFIHELPKLLRHYEDNLALIKAGATTVIGGSRPVTAALAEHYGFEADKLRTVEAFISRPSASTAASLADKGAAKAALGLHPDAVLVTGCGVLHWRKSPDKFIEVAEKAIAEDSVPVHFIWIGGGPDQARCEQMIADKGLGARVRITGYEPDIMRYLAASDVFMLPSEEDPFPLVCLYAASALNPVVCFEKAGGIPDFVASGAGKAVPFGDTEAMAAAVLQYARDPASRARDGLAGRERVAERHTVAAAGPKLLHHIRQAAGLTPCLSVVVPSFNYERYLAKRLASIASQTFQDFEVILLDDASNDDSVAMLEAFAHARPGTTLVVNGANSGSPFAQWLLGMSRANSDLIWLAEADDYADPAFLETLLPEFSNRNVFLAYCKSVPVDAEGRPAGDYERDYLNRIAPDRWARAYCTTDHAEINSGLGIANCIPNASSVILRRFEPEKDFVSHLAALRLCGDWLFYQRAIRGGLIAYSEKPLNFHRRHGATVTHRAEGSPRYFDEIATVRRQIERTYRLEPGAIARMRDFTTGDLDRFGIASERERAHILESLPSADAAPALPAVLFVVSDLGPGGGQLFAIRLANAWTRRGGRAVLLNVGKYPDHPKVKTLVDKRVALFNAGEPETSVRRLAETFAIDIVHSTLWWADNHVFQELRDDPRLPWVITMHGCHDSILERPEIDLGARRLWPEMLKRVDAWVHTAEKNRRLFEIAGPARRELRIDNGVDAVDAEPLSRAALGLRPASLVVALATRAIREKGWLEAVAAVELLNARGYEVDLMLIGEGPVADRLSARLPRHVHLYGHVSDLRSYIAAADVGILPSYFAGESMPLVVLDMMAEGRPVVATDVGELTSIIGGGEDAAGIVVPLRDGKVDIPGFASALASLRDPELRARLGRQARVRFDARYTSELMIEHYHQLYRELTGKTRKT